MKTVYSVLLAAMLLSLAPHAAQADSASHDWSASEGFPSDSAIANRFNMAQEMYLLQSGAAGTTVNSYSSSTTNCYTATACQYGGSSTNLNGVTSTTIQNASGIIVDNNVHTTGTQQDANSVPVSASNISQIKF